MHRIDTSTATADGQFTEGNPTTGVPATVVSGDWLNGVQEEICRVIEGAGLALDKSQTDQLWKAIQRLVAPSASTEEAGTVRLATAEETIAGEDDDSAVTPAGLAAAVVPATTERAGKVELATAEEVQAGEDAERAATPAALAGWRASVEETVAGLVANRVVTPEGLRSIFQLVAGEEGKARLFDIFEIKWGRYAAATPLGEGNGPSISFPEPFVNACWVVMLSDAIPSASATVDAFVQLRGDPTAEGFNTYIQEPGDASSNWRGMHWFAIGV